MDAPAQRQSTARPLYLSSTLKSPFVERVSIGIDGCGQVAKLDAAKATPKDPDQ
jgi:hypothetical protein